MIIHVLCMELFPRERIDIFCKHVYIVKLWQTFGSNLWSATTLSKNTFFSQKKWRNAIKKENFPSQQNCLPFFCLFPFSLKAQMFLQSYGKNSFMYKNRGMISVCNKQCGDDDWPDKKSRHGYIWPWIDILENYFPAISSILYY